MTCADCAAHVRKARSALSGVEEVRLSTWQAGEADVLTDASIPDDAIIKAVESAGYRAKVRERHSLDRGRNAPGAGRTAYDLAIVGGGSAAFAAAHKGWESGREVRANEQRGRGG